MKRNLYALALLLAATSLHAQINITTFKAVSTGSIDSCWVPNATALASFPLFTPTANASWNLSSVALQSTPVVYTYKSKTSGFPTATYIDSDAVSLGNAATNVIYNRWLNIQQTSGATMLLGDEILKRTARTLGGATGNNVDSIVFPAQSVVYSRPLPIIKFPASMGSVWVDSAIRTVSFNMTVTAASVNNAPGVHVQRIRTVDSVVGWGQMKVPILGKLASTWNKVLQVHHYEIAVDSYYLNGAPAPATALAPFGLAQGQSTTTVKTNFLRASAVRPLLEVVHSGATHSSSAKTVYFNAVDLEEDLSVPLSGLGSVRVYPNPVQGGELKIEVSTNAGSNLNYQMIDVKGKPVMQGALDAKGGSLKLPRSTAPGIYYLTLSNAEGAKAVAPLYVP
jgi:hypothetical protein